MKYVAIFTESPTEASARITELFNEGSRIRVATALIGSERTELTRLLEEEGVGIIPVAFDRIAPVGSGIVDILKSQNIDLIALDHFPYELPRDVKKAYEGRIVELTTPLSAPQEIVAALKRAEETAKAPSVLAEDPKPFLEAGSEQEEESEDESSEAWRTLDKETEVPEGEAAQKSVDAEWAETLQIKFDQSRMRTTPPPIPGVSRPAVPHIPETPKNPVNLNTMGNTTGSNGSNLRPNAAPEQPPMPSTYLVWSVIMTVLCCTIPGIVAIVFSSQVSSKYAVGDYAGAEKSSRMAQVWIIVSFCLGVLSATLWGPISLL